jgi:hypothetical protein
MASYLDFLPSKPEIDCRTQELPQQPIKPNILKAGYNPIITKLLVEGFTTGFKIPFTTKEEPTVSTNLKSAKENIDILQTKIDREIALGRVAGPLYIGR